MLPYHGTRVSLLVYTSPTPPGYTQPHSRSQHRCTARAGRSRFPTLEHEVAERTVSDGPLTVAQLCVLTIHPFHCWPVLVFPSDPQGNTVGGGHVAQTALPSIHPFHCWSMLFVRQQFLTFCSL